MRFECHTHIQYTENFGRKCTINKSNHKGVKSINTICIAHVISASNCKAVDDLYLKKKTVTRELVLGTSKFTDFSLTAICL